MIAPAVKPTIMWRVEPVEDKPHQFHMVCDCRLGHPTLNIFNQRTLKSPIFEHNWKEMLPILIPSMHAAMLGGLQRQQYDLYTMAN